MSLLSYSRQLKELRTMPRKELVAYLEGERGMMCRPEESLSELRETAILDLMDENGVKHCGRCSKIGEDRYSLDIYAGHYCDKHWKESGYRDEGASGFNPLDAGESYDDDY